MSGIPWYAFGYSLLLVPIFIMTTDIVVMYRMAVLLNIVFGLLSFWLAYKIIRKTGLHFSYRSVAGALAFTATSYSTYIFHSYIAWSETLLSFLIWLILYEMILFEEKPGCLKGILLGMTAGYGYMVHNRMLAIIAAVLLIEVYFVGHKRIKLQHFISIVLTLMLVFFVYSKVKGYLCDLLTNNVALQDAGVSIALGESNTLSEQISKLKEILTLKGAERFALNMAGQVWQILSATYLIAGLGIVFCMKKVTEAMKKGGCISLYLFPVVALLATIAMTSLFFIEGDINMVSGMIRIDQLFYGRYNDILLGPFIIMALLFLYEPRKVKVYYKYIVAVYLIYLTVSFIIYYSLKDIGSFYLNTVSAVGIHMFSWLGEFAVWKCTLIALLVNAFYMICSFIRLPKQINSYLVCLLLCFFFSTTALKCMQSVIRGENDYIQQYAEIYDFLNENTEKKDIIFTFLEGKAAYDLQTRVVDKMVISIDKSRADFITGSNYIVISGQDYNDFMGTEYIMCLQTNDCIIIQRKVQ